MEWPGIARQLCWWLCVCVIINSGTRPASGGKIPESLRDNSEMADLYKLNKNMENYGEPWTAMDRIVQANLLLEKTSDKDGEFSLYLEFGTMFGFSFSKIYFLSYARKYLSEAQNMQNSKI